ncbi:MAG: hypothetical protein VR69_05540 [Peptococcaceae bacterium BRH_c4b]|nr:MAG: hypothetical protein VR69_05540 [Peptococcaceae bacterium BRH_c4b]
MKKIIAGLTTLLFSLLILTSVAFAGETQGKTLTFDNIYSISNGQHGHYWSGDIDYKVPAKIKKIYRFDRLSYSDSGHNYRYYDKNGKIYYTDGPLYKNEYRNLDLDFDRDGEWHFYKDARGKLHYIYIDPDREGEWHSYKDKDGVTQYYFEDKGWKLN